jgi:hypothetical protein
MKQKVRRIVSELYRKVYAKLEEFAFGLAARQPLPKPKLTRRTAARALLGTGWFLMGLQAIQEWAVAASTLCINILPSCNSQCAVVTSSSFSCCATLINSAGNPVACCQFVCFKWQCLPTISSSSNGINCSGSGNGQVLIFTKADYVCGSGGVCLPNPGSSSAAALRLYHPQA